jgi:hypothetical protein
LISLSTTGWNSPARNTDPIQHEALSPYTKNKGYYTCMHYVLLSHP